MSYRIGQGYDVHAFAGVDPTSSSDESFIRLGGVDIPHSTTLIAHSDGDVLLHAICDAILGAQALGDIGQQFPDTDAQYANIDSRQLLRRCIDLTNGNGMSLVNLDATIVAQAPRMAAHIPAMRKTIAADLKVSDSVVSVKATTTERLGFCGREEGIACMAIVLLEPLSTPSA